MEPGEPAPEFSLKGVDGKTYSLSDLLLKGPVVAAFFKVCCPVCQFTFPFLERMFEMSAGGKATFVAISQDDFEDTRQFCSEFGVKFPAVVDPKPYSVSSQYRLTNVPSIFLVAPDRTVQAVSIGFSREEIEKIASAVASPNGAASTGLFRPGEVVPAYRPG